MSEEKTNNPEPASTGRREALKTLVSIPVLGAVTYGAYKKIQYDRKRKYMGDAFKLDPMPPSSVGLTQTEGKTLRLGIIGFGIRGKQILRAAGFAEPSQIDTVKEAARTNSKDTRYSEYLEQESLNITINGVCDIFDDYGEAAVLAGSNIYREGTNGKFGTPPKRYHYYKDLLAANDIDAVIIAAPDHWHGTMAMDAARAGKHVYLEKPMTWTVPETYMLRDTIKQTGVTFQLGHQGRQTDSYIRAKQVIDKGILGHVSLIEVCTNRNDPNGAWVYTIHENANPKSIDWKQFEGDPDRIKEYMDYMTSNGLARYVGPEPREQFDLPRFFRWRCWWDYSTGLSGDLLTHEYDAINQIMGVGIPHSATSSASISLKTDEQSPMCCKRPSNFRIAT